MLRKCLMVCGVFATVNVVQSASGGELLHQEMEAGIGEQNLTGVSLLPIKPLTSEALVVKRVKGARVPLATVGSTPQVESKPPLVELRGAVHAHSASNPRRQLPPLVPQAASVGRSTVKVLTLKVGTKHAIPESQLFKQRFDTGTRDAAGGPARPGRHFTGLRVPDGVIYTNDGMEWVQFDGRAFEYFGPRKGIINTPDHILDFWDEIKFRIWDLERLSEGNAPRFTEVNMRHVVEMERTYRDFPERSTLGINSPANYITALVDGFTGRTGIGLGFVAYEIELCIERGQPEKMWPAMTRRFGRDIENMIELALGLGAAALWW